MNSSSPTVTEALSTSAPGRLRCRGFTLIELSIAAFIFGLLMAGIMLVYRYSMDSYRITTWKQERLHEAELFWNFLRKNLEEASDKIDIGADLTVDRRPLLYRPLTVPGSNGPVLRWMRSRIGSSGVPEYRIESQVVYANAKVFVQALPTPSNVAPPEELTPKPKDMLSDVRSFSVSVIPIKQDPVRGEYLDSSGSGPHLVVGSLVEISIRFAPPPNSGMPSTIEVTQNHKFKLAVDSEPRATPGAFPVFP